MVPLEDRQVAMSLLLELALQRGTLSHILEALLLLLRLSDLPPFTPDKNRRAHKMEEEDVKGAPHGMDRSSDEADFFPLVSFLRRLASIPTPAPPYPHIKAGQEVQVGVVFSEHDHHMTFINIIIICTYCIHTCTYIHIHTA